MHRKSTLGNSWTFDCDSFPHGRVGNALRDLQTPIIVHAADFFEKRLDVSRRRRPDNTVPFAVRERSPWGDVGKCPRAHLG